MDRELPPATHRQTAAEGGRSLTEPAPLEVRVADGREGADEGERAIGAGGEVQRMLGRGQCLVEAPQLGQRRGNIVEAELGQTELGWPSGWTVARGRARGVRRRPTSFEEGHRLPVSTQTPVDLAETEVRLYREPLVRHGLRQVKGALARRERAWQIAADPGVVAHVGGDPGQPCAIVELLRGP